ncbi:MAG: hypothetical protein LBK63_08510, partial [Treponema sp.]|nr:hypothetical protein [Treponema sp.]
CPRFFPGFFPPALHWFGLILPPPPPPHDRFAGKIDFFTPLAAIWLVLSVIFAGIFVIEEHDHEHIDALGHGLPSREGCQICLEIQITQGIIETFGYPGASTIVIGYIAGAPFSVKPLTPFPSKSFVELRVRLNC